MARYNPFKPGSIVHPGMFAGRTDELAILNKALFQTSNGNATHFLIHGERGIGKSSLLLVVDWLAKGSIVYDEHKYSFLTVNVELEPSDGYADIILKTARELHRELERNEQVKRLLKDVWTFITSWEVMGVKYKRDSTPIDAMLEELADKFIAVASKMKEPRQGIYLFIDESDKPEISAGLGEFAKVFTERLSKRGAYNVGVGIIGISTVIAKMRASHESSIRIFTPLELEPLKPGDRKDVVRRGLEDANKKNANATSVTDEALELISNFSEGYPHFIQQYAYCAFDQDQDWEIDVDDVRRAFLGEKGALQLLGERFFENMYTDEIRSDDYRTVLQVAARHFPNYVARKTLITESGLKSHTVDNALTALTRRGSLIARKGVSGQFRLPSQSFATWILAFKIAQQ
jgi:hypothetical protein